MDTLDRLSASSSASDHGDHDHHNGRYSDDLTDSDEFPSQRPSHSFHDGSSFDHRSFDHRSYHVRSVTPTSWYMGLATAPPRPEDFLIYDEPPSPAPYTHMTQPDPADDWMQRLNAKRIEVFDKLPSTPELIAAGELPVYDSRGTPHAFKSLYRGPASRGSRQLVILIRHVFCEGCRAYVKQLSEAIAQTDPSDPDYTSVTLISCSSYKLIDMYKKFMSDDFRIYADPSRKLFRALGCKAWSFSLGPAPHYLQGKNKQLGAISSVIQYGKSLPKRGFGGGSLFQIGGEFLFEHGELTWCHRMRRIFDHAEMSTIKQVLGVWEDDQRTLSEVDSRADDDASVSQDSCQLITEPEMQRIKAAIDALDLEGSTQRSSLQAEERWRQDLAWDPNRQSIFGSAKPRKKSSRVFENAWSHDPQHDSLGQLCE